MISFSDRTIAQSAPRSQDGGASWTIIHHSANLTAVQWLDITGPNTGWAVVARGSAQAQLLTRANNEMLLTTSDGGATWTPAA